MTPADWLAAITNDPDPYTALAIVADDLEDQGDHAAAHCFRKAIHKEPSMLNPPFEIGQEWLIKTVTLYYVGRIKARGLGWVLLEHASWVHWTGRVSVLAKHRKFTGSHFGSRKPRTEYIGDELIATESIVSATPGPWELPKESVQ